MREHARNVLVGLTVIVALVLLGAMIVLFTGLPEAFRRGRVLRIHFPDTGDMHPGDWVHLAGLRIGKVTDVAFVDGDPRRGVEFVARIDEGVRIPADVEPRIYSRGFVGGGHLVLVPGGPERFDLRTGRKLDFLPDDWDRPLVGTLKGAEVLPQEVTEGLRGLAKLAETLNDLIAPPQPATATAPGATQPVGVPAAPNLRGTLAKLARALDALDAVLGDAENQANVKASMANLAKATAKAADAMVALREFAAEATKTAAETRKTVAEARQAVTQAAKAAGKFADLADHTDSRIEKLSQKFLADAEKLSDLMTALHRVATKIEAGEGTAGKLVNDPKLYSSLVEASDQLTRLVKEFRELVAQWKKQGVLMKLK
jgi:phospholipid/cholesterol/gamma-HCH transport system substrate-binding protein